MSELIVLRDVMAQANDDIDLWQLWPADSVQPELVLYGSSGEYEMLTQPEISQWSTDTLNKYRHAEHAFVSMACTSLMAAIQEFKKSTAKTGLVFILETPASYLQVLLNHALGEEQGKIIVNECVGRVVLKKVTADEVLPDDLIVRACSIFAKPKGIMSDAMLINKLGNWLRAQTPPERPADFVSFRVQSEWSDQLLMGFDKWVRSSANLANVLPSLEPDENHWLAVKPLFEILHYSKEFKQRDVVVSTLGGGGRLGAMLLQTGDPDLASCSIPQGIPVYLDDVTPGNNQVIQRDEKPRYCDITYRQDDTYFYSTCLRTPIKAVGRACGHP